MINNKRTFSYALLVLLLLVGQTVTVAQESDAGVKLKASVDLDISTEDKDVLNTVDLEEVDDLDSLKTDIGEIIFEADEESKEIDKAIVKKEFVKMSKSSSVNSSHRKTKPG